MQMLPTSEGDHLFEFHTPSDHLNRRTFTVHSWGYNPTFDTDTPRGQEFFCDPKPHIERLRTKGHRVRFDDAWGEETNDADQ